MKGIVGRKVGMTQLLTERGIVVPVTVIEAGPCYVTQIKTSEKDGYTAIQLGYQETKPRRMTKGQIGHLRRRNANLPALRVLREFRLKNVADYRVGQKILRLTSSSSVSWWMCRAPPRVAVFRVASSATTSVVARAPMASPTVCARRVQTARARRRDGCYKGKHMAGHMGNVPVTVCEPASRTDRS